MQVTREPQNDRAMLEALHQEFETGIYECPDCGHDGDIKILDIAYMLRDYLAAHPATSPCQIESAVASHECGAELMQIITAMHTAHLKRWSAGYDRDFATQSLHRSEEERLLGELYNFLSAESGTPLPKKGDVPDERAAFEQHWKHLDFAYSQPAWSEKQYINSHVQALWEGWQARAELGNTVEQSVPDTWNALYICVNHMMAELGRVGEIDTKCGVVDEVMNALHAIDGGVVSKRAMELHEKAFMPMDQATSLALREQEAIAKPDSVHLAAPAETSTDTSLVSALQGRADAAYCTCLRLLSDTPCLGAEHKLLTGKFTTANLKAHCKASEHLGAHKAFTEALNLVSANYYCRPNNKTFADKTGTFADTSNCFVAGQEGKQ